MKKFSIAFLKRILIILSFITLIPFSAFAHRDLTVVDWGGDLARAHMQAWVIPWEEASGKQAELVYYGGGVDEIRDQVNTTNVTWDVVDMEYSDMIQACSEGLLVKIDHQSLPDVEDDFMEGSLVSECGVGVYIWSTVYAYNKNKFGNSAPSTISDFFDTRKFPGNRGLRKDPRGALEWALISQGVSPGDVYNVLSTQAGLDKAFAVLDKIKPFIVWWSGGGEPVQLLNEGKVSISAAWNGRLFRPIVEDNAPIGIVWDGQIWEIEFLSIVKGSRNVDNAVDFIKLATSSKGMSDVAGFVPYGPTRTSAQKNVPTSVLPYLPTQNMGATSLRYDSPWWAANIERIRARFDEWLRPSSLDIEGRGAR